jgi:hypothetical protein
VTIPIFVVEDSPPAMRALRKRLAALPDVRLVG